MPVMVGGLMVVGLMIVRLMEAFGVTIAATINPISRITEIINVRR
jgi:hypothetical protein